VDLELKLHQLLSLPPDGTYAVRYNPAVPGQHVVDVKLNGQPIFETPAQVDVDHNTQFVNEAHPRWSEGIGAGTENANTTEPAKFTVQAKNRYGNKVTKGGLTLKSMSKRLLDQAQLMLISLITMTVLMQSLSNQLLLDFMLLMFL
jgi:hypothetical protein